jgi:tight adherence protein B
MVVLGALAGMGLAAGAWLLATSLWGTVTRDGAPTRPRRAQRTRVPPERVALIVAAGLVTLFVSRWPVAGLGAAVAAWWIPLPGQRADRQRAEARTAALAQWCATLRDAAGTARGIEGILTATAPAAPAPIRAEVGRMATRLEAQRLDVVLDRLADDLAHPIGDLVVTALRLASTAGSRRVRQVLGDLATAAELEASMRRRVDVARQRPRSTMQLVAAIVAAFVVGLIVFAGDYLAPYGTAIGQLVLAGVALYWAAGFWWMARLGRLPQAQRFLIRASGADR